MTHNLMGGEMRWFTVSPTIGLVQLDWYNLDWYNLAPPRVSMSSNVDVQRVQTTTALLRPRPPGSAERRR
jgi:hypothetical protein